MKHLSFKQVKSDQYRPGEIGSLSSWQSVKLLANIKGVGCREVQILGDPQNEMKGGYMKAKRYFEFVKRKSNPETRSRLITIPEDKIEKIETIFGSHNVYCVINDIEVEGSYENLLKQLGTVVKMHSLT